LSTCHDAKNPAGSRHVLGNSERASGAGAWIGFTCPGGGPTSTLSCSIRWVSCPELLGLDAENQFPWIAPAGPEPAVHAQSLPFTAYDCDRATNGGGLHHGRIGEPGFKDCADLTRARLAPRPPHGS